MPTLDYSDEYAEYDPEFLALLANLDLRDVPSAPASPRQPERHTAPASPSGRGHVLSHRTQPSQTAQTLTPPRHTPAAPPRTPSRAQPPPPYSAGSHTFPTGRSRSSHSSSPTLYCFNSPTSNGVTMEWSVAAGATQGVHNGHVYALMSPRKPRTKKAAYVVFCGRRLNPT
ncbi:hypothetical protein B0H13DRAFT_1879461 [Mycena leptocephala]|nr:hypothetical protein B0H13DRAFT_1879461 [Mycena leptocephala]